MSGGSQTRMLVREYNRLIDPCLEENRKYIKLYERVMGHKTLTLLCNIFTATVRPIFISSLSVLRGEDFFPFPTSIVCFKSLPLYTFPNAPSPMILFKEMSLKRTSNGSDNSELDLKTCIRQHGSI